MRRVGAVVPLEECKRRALVYLAGLDWRTLTRPNCVALAIWPDGQNMRSQGAGLAAVRILRQLDKEGLARWESRYSMGKYVDDGWTVTAAGRAKIESNA